MATYHHPNLQGGGRYTLRPEAWQEFDPHFPHFSRAHLQAVKKVSYGKHIVARVEKLVVEVNGGGASGAKAEARVVEDEKAGPGLGPGEGGEERSG